MPTRPTARIGGVLGLIALGEEREQRLANEGEAEALRRSNELKTALLRTVSHDFRSPLTAISTAAEGLRYAELDTDELELVQTISDQSGRLSRIVRTCSTCRGSSRASSAAADWLDPRDWSTPRPRRTGRTPGRGDWSSPTCRSFAPTPPSSARAREPARERPKFSAPGEPVAGPGDRAGGRSTSRCPTTALVSRSPSARTSSARSTAAAAAGSPAPGSGWRSPSGLAVANGATLTLEPANGAGATLTVSIPASPTPEGGRE